MKKIEGIDRINRIKIAILSVECNLPSFGTSYVNDFPERLIFSKDEFVRWNAVNPMKFLGKLFLNVGEMRDGNFFKFSNNSNIHQH